MLNHSPSGLQLIQDWQQHKATNEGLRSRGWIPASFETNLYYSFRSWDNSFGALFFQGGHEVRCKEVYIGWKFLGFTSTDPIWQRMQEVIDINGNRTHEGCAITPSAYQRIQKSTSASLKNTPERSLSLSSSQIIILCVLVGFFIPLAAPLSNWSCTLVSAWPKSSKSSPRSFRPEAAALSALHPLWHQTDTPWAIYYWHCPS